MYKVYDNSLPIEQKTVHLNRFKAGHTLRVMKTLKKKNIVHSSIVI